MNRHGIFRCLLVLFVGLMFFAVCSTAQACPTCADGMNNDENAASLLQGYFWSIVFMMSMPFTVLSCVAIYFYLQVRKHRQATQSEPQRQPVLPTELPPGVLLAKSAQ